MSSTSEDAVVSSALCRLSLDGRQNRDPHHNLSDDGMSENSDPDVLDDVLDEGVVAQMDAMFLGPIDELEEAAAIGEDEEDEDEDYSRRRK